MDYYWVAVVVWHQSVCLYLFYAKLLGHCSCLSTFQLFLACWALADRLTASLFIRSLYGQYKHINCGKNTGKSEETRTISLWVQPGVVYSQRYWIMSLTEVFFLNTDVISDTRASSFRIPPWPQDYSTKKVHCVSTNKTGDSEFVWKNIVLSITMCRKMWPVEFIHLTLAMTPTCHSNNTLFISWHEFFLELYPPLFSPIFG